MDAPGKWKKTQIPTICIGFDIGIKLPKISMQWRNMECDLDNDNDYDVAGGDGDDNDDDYDDGNCL